MEKEILLDLINFLKDKINFNKKEIKKYLNLKNKNDINKAINFLTFKMKVKKLDKCFFNISHTKKYLLEQKKEK